MTPVSAQIPGSPNGASSSALPSAAVQPVSVDTPAEATDNTATQVSPSRSMMNGHLPPTASKTRLAHDTIGILQDRIQEDPRGDPEAYLELIKELKSRNKATEVREVYDDYLKTFPRDVSTASQAFRSLLIVSGRSVVFLHPLGRGK